MKNLKKFLLKHKEIGIFIIILIIIAGLVLVGSIIFHVPTKKNITQQRDAKEEAALLLAKIGTFYDLPRGETPTIATVQDKTKLQAQPFFAKAENGDKVLIYTNAKKALLYRPSINKIMEVSPLSFNTPSPTPITESITPVAKSILVSIYNGTKTIGLAGTMEKKLIEKYGNITVVEKGNATKDYGNTMVIDTNGNNSEVAKNIAAFLEGSVAALPQGEKNPKGEVLIILGK